MSNDVSEWPQTIDAAIDRLLVELNDTDKVAPRAMSKDDLIDLHFDLGMYIRNTFGLWQGNTALLVACTKQGDSFIHPDDASGVIIEALWKRLQAQP